MGENYLIGSIIIGVLHRSFGPAKDNYIFVTDVTTNSYDDGHLPKGGVYKPRGQDLGQF